MFLQLKVLYMQLGGLRESADTANTTFLHGRGRNTPRELLQHRTGGSRPPSPELRKQTPGSLTAPEPQVRAGSGSGDGQACAGESFTTIPKPNRSGTFTARLKFAMADL